MSFYWIAVRLPEEIDDHGKKLPTIKVMNPEKQNVINWIVQDVCERLGSDIDKEVNEKLNEAEQFQMKGYTWKLGGMKMGI